MPHSERYAMHRGGGADERRTLLGGPNDCLRRIRIVGAADAHARDRKSRRRTCDDARRCILNSNHSKCSDTANDDTRGAHQDNEVQHERPVFDVVQVEVRCAVHRNARVTIDLPPAGDTWGHQVARVLPVVVRRHDLRKLGPRSDDAHIAAKSVPELWNLVEATPSQKASNSGQARVFGGFVRAAALTRVRWRADVAFASIGSHRSELPDLERFSVAPNPLLPEEDRSPAIEQNCQRDQPDEGRENHQRSARDDNIERALDRPSEAASHAGRERFGWPRRGRCAGFCRGPLGDEYAKFIRATPVWRR